MRRQQDFAAMAIDGSMQFNVRLTLRENVSVGHRARSVAARYWCCAAAVGHKPRPCVRLPSSNRLARPTGGGRRSLLLSALLLRENNDMNFSFKVSVSINCLRAPVVDRPVASVGGQNHGTSAGAQVDLLQPAAPPAAGSSPAAAASAAARPTNHPCCCSCPLTKFCMFFDCEPDM